MTAAMTAVITGSLSTTLQNQSCSVIYVDSSRQLIAAMTAAMAAVITGSLIPTLQNKIFSVLYVDSSRHV